MKISTLPVSLRIIFYLLPLSCCLASCLQLVYFRFLEEQAAPKFEALNQGVFDELPPPPGIIELERRVSGREPDGEHGSYLSVDYSMGQMTEEQIRSYYTDLLLSKGWLVDPPSGQSDSRYYYRRGTSCLRLIFYPKMPGGSQYHIGIWHDFWSQSFGPSKPVPILLPIVDMDSPGALECNSSSIYP